MEYLKPNHCLKERDIIPVVMALAEMDEEMPIEKFATLKEKYPLRSYSSEDLYIKLFTNQILRIGIKCFHHSEFWCCVPINFDSQIFAHAQL